MSLYEKIIQFLANANWNELINMVVLNQKFWFLNFFFQLLNGSNLSKISLNLIGLFQKKFIIVVIWKETFIFRSSSWLFRVFSESRILILQHKKMLKIYKTWNNFSFFLFFPEIPVAVVFCCFCWKFRK